MGEREQDRFSRAERSFLKHLALQSDDEVVDLSFGNEKLALAVAGLVPQGRLTLLTHDEAVKSSIERRIRETGVGKVATAIVAGAGDLPAARFDLAYLVTRPYLSNAQIAAALVGARHCLKSGGRLLLFADKHHGAATVLRRAEEVFGNLEILDKPGGTRIARCLAESSTMDRVAGPEADNDEPFTVDLFGHVFRFISFPGVFSKGELDEGTRLLLETVEAGPSDRIADLGCGYGAIGIVAARRAAQGCATLIDADLQAVSLARRNIALNKIDNAEVLLSNGFSAVDDRQFDLVLSNPPLHSAPGTLERLTEEARDRLQPGGRLAYVVHKAYDVRSILKTVFGEASILAETSEFRVIGATRRK